MRRQKPPLLQCIYCGYASWNESDFGDEHIIPEGLGGIDPLPAASCHACERIINKFETKCIVGLFDEGRRELRLHQKKKRARTTTVRVNSREGAFLREQTGLGSPRVLFLPVLLQSEAYTGARTDTWRQVDWRVYAWTKDLTLILTKETSLNNEIAYDEPSFLRFLAKIAHGHMAEQFGPQGFIHVLPKIILGQSNEATKHVGSSHVSLPDLPYPDRLDEPYAAHRREHVVENVSGVLNRVVSVKIRLFALLPESPTYEVIAGFLPPET